MFSSKLELTAFASGAKPGELRDLVPPAPGGNKGLLGVVYRGQPPTLIDTETGKAIEVPFETAAAGLAIRPTRETKINSERNQEVAIVYGAKATNVEFYDVSLGEWLAPYAFPRAISVAYSMQGDKVAIGNANGYIAVLDLTDSKRKELFVTKVCGSAMVQLAFTGQGETVVALTARGACYAVNVATGDAKQEVFVGAEEDDDFDCWAQALHPLARLAVFAGSANRESGRCKIWVCDLDRGSRICIDTDHALFVRRVQFISAKRIIVFGDTEAQVYDLTTRQKVCTRQAGDVVTSTYAAVKAGPFTFVVGASAPEVVAA